MLKLSHILPPGVHPTDTSSSNPSIEESCPRAVIGALPAAAGLHLAIAHQLGERPAIYRETDAEFGVDDLTVSEPLVVSAKEKITDRSTLIIASSRSRWHESILEENDAWIRECAGVPEVSDALKKIDVKYCQQPKDALILCALLHAAGDEEIGAASGVKDVPALIIAWDLFGLFVGDQDAGSGEDGAKESAKGIAEMRSDTSIQDYLSLISLLRQACEQIGVECDGPAPTLVILEPQMTSVTEFAITTSVIPPSTRAVDGKNQKHLKLVRGLEWVLAPGYAEDKTRRTVVEISKVDEKNGGTEDDPPTAAERPPDVERFIVSSAGDNIASFERRLEAEAPGKPCLDRVGSSYKWISIKEPLGREDA